METSRTSFLGAGGWPFPGMDISQTPFLSAEARPIPSTATSQTPAPARLRPAPVCFWVLWPCQRLDIWSGDGWVWRQDKLWAPGQRRWSRPITSYTICCRLTRYSAIQMCLFSFSFLCAVSLLTWCLDLLICPSVMNCADSFTGVMIIDQVLLRPLVCLCLIAICNRLPSHRLLRYCNELFKISPLKGIV
jgi:hypothetical protein